MSKNQVLTVCWLHGGTKGKEWVGIGETRITTKLTEFFLKSSPDDLLISFRERGRAGVRRGKKHQCERQTPISYVWRTEPSTQASVLTGIQPMAFSFMG